MRSKSQTWRSEILARELARICTIARHQSASQHADLRRGKYAPSVRTKRLNIRVCTASPTQWISGKRRDRCRALQRNMAPGSRWQGNLIAIAAAVVFCVQSAKGGKRVSQSILRVHQEFSKRLLKASARLRKCATVGHRPMLKSYGMHAIGSSACWGAMRKCRKDGGM